MTEIYVEPPRKNVEGIKNHEAALKIYDMLKQGRRYFGSSGASLTHQAFNPSMEEQGINPALAKIGLEGERDTTLFLKKWMKEHAPNAVLIDSVHIKGWGQEEVNEETGIIEGGDTDHIMLIGDEVLLIDTKRWKKKSNYSIADDGSVLRANREFPGGNLGITRAINMWLDYLHDSVLLTGIVCINAEETVVFRNRNWFTQRYRLVELARMEELLNLKYNEISEENKNKINSTLVAQIAVNCVKPFDPYSRVFDMDSIRGFR